MPLLKCLASLRLLKINCPGLGKGFEFEKQVFREFHQLNNLTLHRCIPKIKAAVSCYSSVKIRQESDKDSTSSDLLDHHHVEKESKEELLNQEDYQEDEDLEEEEYFKNLEEEECNRVDLFKDISKDDPEVFKKLQFIEYEMALLEEKMGFKLPKKISKKHWIELLSLPSVAARCRCLQFLALNEMSTQNQAAKGKLLLQKFLEKRAEIGFHHYALGGHTMFRRIDTKSINQLLSLRQMRAKTKIIFDCSYQEYMSQLNVRHCAKQIFMSLSAARHHQYPCRIEFCNFNHNDFLGKIFPQYVREPEKTFSAVIYEKSYVDLYPKEQLIYLSPHAPDDLTEFRTDCIYIIGAFVDKGTGGKVSFAKARENNIKMAKFPLDFYLSWKSGTKNFPLNVVTKILLDMYFYNDWSKALRHVPARSVHRPRSYEHSCELDLNFG